MILLVYAATQSQTKDCVAALIFNPIYFIFPKGLLMKIFTHFKESFLKRQRNEDGFMGYTHALSALAVVMMLLAFVPMFVPKIVGNENIWVICMFVLGTIGASMIPDLDNSTSRAKSDLGIFGIAISGFFRVSSTIIQTTIRTKRDDPDPNPHRGFWHTIPAALFLGLLAYLATLVKGEINIPVFGAMTWGTVFAMLIVAILIHLTLSTLFKEAMDKLKKSEFVGEFIALLISLSIAFTLFLNIPKNESFWWVGVSVALGMIIHDFGDAFTKSGNVLLFPCSAFLKGKFWWTTRFTHMKAGGTAEKMLVVPICVILTCVAIVKMSIEYFS